MLVVLHLGFVAVVAVVAIVALLYCLLLHARSLLFDLASCFWRACCFVFIANIEMDSR